MAVGETSILQARVTASTTLTQFRGATITGAPASTAGNGYPCATGGGTGDTVPVVLLGVAIGEAGAAVSAGALLVFNASGQYITRSAGVTVGRAMNAASFGDTFQVFVIPN